MKPTSRNRPISGSLLHRLTLPVDLCHNVAESEIEERWDLQVKVGKSYGRER